MVYLFNKTLQKLNKMTVNRFDIEQMDRIERLKVINTITGIKPGNLIGTTAKEHGSNLAIFSSLVHLGSNPALVGFVLRPTGEIKRNTYENILENGFYTINHIHQDLIKQAHYTSVKFDHGVSEFEECGLTEEFLMDFPAPYVAESHLKMGVKFEEEVYIKSNNTRMIVGSVEALHVPDHCFDTSGYLRLDRLKSVGIGGLNNYYSLEYMDSFPYARKNELPRF